MSIHTTLLSANNIPVNIIGPLDVNGNVKIDIEDVSGAV